VSKDTLRRCMELLRAGGYNSNDEMILVGRGRREAQH
jgi:hypothetical protein